MFVKPLDDFNLSPFNIPNIDSFENSFTDFITEEEEVILRSLFGNTLYDEFIEGIAEDTPDEKWTLLRDGDTYQDGGVTNRWIGLRKMLKGYIYFRWLEDNEETLTGIGVVKGKAENAVVLSAWPKMVRAWNAFAKAAGANESMVNSLFGYVKAKGVYSNFAFSDPKLKNRFDI